MTKDPKVYDDYKRYLNIFTRVKELARESYLAHRAALYSQDRSKTWQFINEISKRKRKKTN